MPEIHEDIFAITRQLQQLDLEELGKLAELREISRRRGQLYLQLVEKGAGAAPIPRDQAGEPILVGDTVHFVSKGRFHVKSPNIRVGKIHKITKKHVGIQYVNTGGATVCKRAFHNVLKVQEKRPATPPVNEHEIESPPSSVGSLFGNIE